MRPPPAARLPTALVLSDTGVLTLSDPQRFASIELLCNKPGWNPVGTYTLNFADGTTTSGSINWPDWNQGSNAIQTGVAQNGGAYASPGVGLGDFDIPLASADQGKLLMSISFSGGGYSPWIMAVSGSAFAATLNYANAVNVAADSTIDLHNVGLRDAGKLEHQRQALLDGRPRRGLTVGAVTLSGGAASTQRGHELDRWSRRRNRRPCDERRGTMVLGASGNYSGGTTINAGTLQLGAALALGSRNGNLAVNNAAVLDLNGNSVTAAVLSGAGTIGNSGSGAYCTLAVGANNASSTFSGAIQDGNGQVKLAKSGTGALVLDRQQHVHRRHAHLRRDPGGQRHNQPGRRHDLRQRLRHGPGRHGQRRRRPCLQHRRFRPRATSPAPGLSRPPASRWTRAAC